MMSQSSQAWTTLEGHKENAAAPLNNLGRDAPWSRCSSSEGSCYEQLKMTPFCSAQGDDSSRTHQTMERPGSVLQQSLFPILNKNSVTPKSTSTIIQKSDKSQISVLPQSPVSCTNNTYLVFHPTRTQLV